MAKKIYSSKYKNRIVKSIQPPENKPPTMVAKEERIPISTIYGWISKGRKKGLLIPNHNQPTNDGKWRTEDKFTIVLETYSLNEEELGIYCRKHGLYSTDIKQWRKTIEDSLETTKPTQEEKEQNVKIKNLQKELRYKEKALAEAAALLMLQKKVQAIWADQEVE